MKKPAYYLIVVMALLFFVAVMNSGSFLARGLSDDFRDMRHSLQSEEWKQAEINCQDLMLAWRNTVARIQFSVEKDEINAINVNLARMKAHIELRQNNEAYVELLEAMEHWENLNH